MQFKLSLVAASLLATLTLTGCNDDSSSTPTAPDVENPSPETGNPDTGKPDTGNPTPVTTGQFIDAKVQGLDYVIGTKAAQTDAEGNYELGAENGTISFYIGGKDGLLIGSVSGRAVTTPFEAAGTYERSINLARLLLTINEHNDDSTIIIPSLIKDNPSTDIQAALAKITLDDGYFEKSVETLLTLLDSKALVAAADAQKHMQASLNPEQLQRGSDEVLTQWAKGSNQIIIHRSANLRVKNSSDETFKTVIHQDQQNGKYVGGLSLMNYKLTDDQFIILAGSNDSTIEKTSTLPSFVYEMTNKAEAYTENEMMPWSEIETMGSPYACMTAKNCSERLLTQANLEYIERQDGDHKQKEAQSGTYDPVTQVYTQIRSKEYLDGDYAGRISESIEFFYPVADAKTDRFVDFTGTWTAKETRPDCHDVATSNLTFGENTITLTGQEFIGKCDIADGINETITYEDFAKMDFWWFGTNDKVSTATLDQLNTTVRWNDKDTGETTDNFKINRFSYIPAGKAWDKGVLVRDTLSDNGAKVATITMKKS
ncbi:chromosome partitioning protein ParA [Photobacterium sp. GB-36]|uniref:chromosome partitioning protein ParA n=1 Tax=Photobacterium sp. GB-36 TaxID=2022108 RepID=UPI000D16B274|nr:chromosome partitioning protein ParA [Photobacterium sp. GB-36]PSV41268.1 chromosome partitioning protein ParA [Photobacterium sp. GB-36]